MVIPRANNLLLPDKVSGHNGEALVQHILKELLMFI
jgi:hypothetical protein